VTWFGHDVQATTLRKGGYNVRRSKEFAFVVCSRRKPDLSAGAGLLGRRPLRARGGLAPWPAGAWGLTRVRTWVWAKLLINAVRILMQ
jgi:hypothetical protein